MKINKKLVLIVVGILTVYFLWSKLIAAKNRENVETDTSVSAELRSGDEIYAT